ncbi:hypothetical protein HZS_7118, partial [Henneguya salminicola]
MEKLLLIPAFSERKNLRVSAPTFMRCDMGQDGNKSVKIVATYISIATKMIVKMEKTCQIVRTVLYPEKISETKDQDKLDTKAVPMNSKK